MVRSIIGCCKDFGENTLHLARSPSRCLNFIIRRCHRQGRGSFGEVRKWPREYFRRKDILSLLTFQLIICSAIEECRARCQAIQGRTSKSDFRCFTR
jgi:hypothetical protein